MIPLPAQPDLYAALRQSGAGPDDLGAVIAACDRDTAARLRSVDQGLLRAVLRAGQGGPAIVRAPAVVAWLQAADPAPIFRPDIAASRHMALPTNGQLAEMPAFSDRAFDPWFASQRVDYGLGLYAEDRTVYRSAQFADAASPERRTRHLGIDVFAPAGTAVHAPFDGVVQALAYNADPLDYGHTLILRHHAGDEVFFTLYGHLAGTLPGLLREGMPVTAGQHIADLGDWPENGGWAPHLHLQVITDMLDQRQNFFGVGHNSLWDIWQCISPDPNLILRLPPSALAR